MKTTISGLLSLQRALATRRNQLQALAESSSKVIRWMEQSRIEEPKYDVRELDKKVTELNNALFIIDQTIKAINAETHLEIEIDYDSLMSPIT